VKATSMAGDEAGRRGVPSLLSPSSSSSSEGQQEHIASDVTQVKAPAPYLLLVLCLLSAVSDSGAARD
jgi:cysteine synthase A